jgi:hypothetical protein
LLQIPSVPPFSLALAASGQPATLLFSVANMPLAVCAWLVLDAAVPWNLYPLKSDKRNLDRRIVCCFKAALFLWRFSAARKKRMNLGLDVRIQIGDELLNLVSDCEGEAILRRCIPRWPSVESRSSLLEIQLIRC